MKRNPTILFGILALLAIATYFVFQREGETSLISSAGEPLVRYDSAAVDRLEIHSKDATVVLEKQGGKWMMTSPVRYAADDNGVASAVGKGRDMKITSLVSTNPAKQNIYSVDSTGTLVKFFANGADVSAFRLGKPSASYTETYAKKEGSNDVYLTEGVTSATFVKSANDWRSKTIFKTEQSKLNSVTIRFAGSKPGADTTFTLTKKDSVNWVIGGDSTVNSNVSSFVTSLADFQTDEFVDSTITVMPKLSAMIEAGGTQFRFYKRADNKYYVQSSAWQQWFAIQEWKANNLLKRKTDFVPAKQL
jgi:hypothetical protein